MKSFFYALTALIALSLSACTTFNPMGATATVYPVAQDTVVEAPAQVEAAVEQMTQVAAAPATNDMQSELDTLVDQLQVTQVPELYVDEKQLTCMAYAIYHEARGESERGQAAVGWVVTNRVNHGKYPPSVCGVVYQRGKRGCQFSWVCDGKSDQPRDANSYQKARDIARRVMTAQIPNPVGRAIFFDGYVHGTPRKPGQQQIGNHRFYASYAKR